MLTNRNPTKTNLNDTDGLPLPKRYWAILATALGVGMSVIDGTIANVALPTIARDLGTAPSVTIWVVNAYQLAITISLLSFSSLGDIYGYRRIYLTGIGIFSITSLICALSGSFWTLTIARILQGFGAAAITSVNTAILRIIYPKKFIGRGMGINAMVVAVSIAAGPTIASAILSIGSWHWLFAINVPFGIAALIIGLMHLPQNPVKVYGRHFDKISCLMNALTFGLLIFSLEGIAHKKSAFIIFGCLFALSIIGFFFIHRQLRQRFPLLPVDLLRIPIFIDRNFHMFFCRADVGDDLTAFLLARHIGKKRCCDRIVINSLAFGDYNHGTYSRTACRKDSPRYFRRGRNGCLCKWLVSPRNPSARPYRYGYHLAIVFMRSRIRSVSNAQQQYHHFVCTD